MRRKGLGKSKGQGYKNILGNDSGIHSMSSKGIKQPQKMKCNAMPPPPPPPPNKPKINLYLQLNNKTQKEVDNFPMEFAFSDEQLKEGLKKLGGKKEDVISIGGGGFIRKTDKVKYLLMREKHNKEHNDNLKNKDYVYQMFRYELANHEYCITYDEYDTLESVGLKREQIDKNPLWSEQLEKAKKDYLKNSGDC